MIPECEGCQALMAREPPPFDEAEAQKLLEGWKPETEYEAIDGNPGHAEVRKRWPRREDTCLLCGERTIRYASEMHYLLGDW